MSSTLKAMRLCRFQCSTATATMSPPTNNMFVSFRYCIHTWDKGITLDKMYAHINKPIHCGIFSYLHLWTPWCQIKGKGELEAKRLQPEVEPLCTSTLPSGLSHKHILPPAIRKNYNIQTTAQNKDITFIQSVSATYLWKSDLSS